MVSRPSKSTGGWIREVGLWGGLGIGVFCIVAAVLLLTEDEPQRPEAPSESPTEVAVDTDAGQGSGSRLDGGVDAPLSAGLDVGGELGDTDEPVAPKLGGDLTGEELEDAKTAVGEIPPEGLPQVPVVPIPPGVIEQVEGSRDWLVHTVVDRETVDQLAYRYGVKPESLRMWNGIDGKAKRAKKGSRLRIKARRIPPPRVELQYVVRPGDSWTSIGIRYGVDSSELRSTNRDAAQQLRVGQIIRMWVDPVVFEWVATEDDDPSRVRPGAVGIGPPQDGRLVNGVRLPDSPFYELRLPPSSFGTTFAVEALLRGVVLFKARSDYGRSLTFGSMSWRHGGPLTGHVSHQSGRDLDIQLPLLEKYPAWFPVEPKRVDWDTTWQLVTAMVDTADVVVVFLDYDLQKPLFKAAARLGATEDERKRYLQWPRGAKAQGLVRHSRGHTSHIHVRFACGPYEVECADKTLGTE